MTTAARATAYNAAIDAMEEAIRGLAEDAAAADMPEEQLKMMHSMVVSLRPFLKSARQATAGIAQLEMVIAMALRRKDSMKSEPASPGSDDGVN